MEKIVFPLSSSRDRIDAAKACAEVPDGWIVTIKPPTRTLDQNSLMWPHLVCLEKQLEWPLMINGKWQQSKLSDVDWKDFLTGSFDGDARRLALGMNNTGLIMLGSRTSGYGKKKFSEFIEFIKAFGAQHNVDFERK